MSKKLLAFLFFTWLAALLALTYWPNLHDVEVKVGDEWWRTDYLGHFGFYLLLVLFFLVWQRARGKEVTSNYILMVALAGVAFGAITEFTQQLTPGRSLNPFDMMYNCLGVVAGGLAFRFYPWKKKRRD